MLSNPTSPNGAESNEAWKFVRRLAGERQRVIEGTDAHNDSTAIPSVPSPLFALAGDPGTDDILFISEQAQHHFAEIERASTALRSAQPDLEAWSISNIEAVQTRKPRSVWLVVGAIWISTVLLMGMATFAIASLLR